MIEIDFTVPLQTTGAVLLVTERVERAEPLRDDACQEWLFQYLMEINGKRRNCGIVSNASGDGKAQKLNTLMLKR